MLVLNYGFRYFWEGTPEKGCIEIGHWGFFAQFVLRVEDNSIYTLHLCCSENIKKGYKVYTKSDSWFQKGTWGIWTTSDKQWKVQKVEVWWAFVSKKNIPPTKTLYTEDLFNITFNYLCENSPNYLCHFWNHKSFFTTQLLYIFLAQTLHTFYRSSSLKWKFSYFPLLRLKFTKFKFTMSFFK